MLHDTRKYIFCLQLAHFKDYISFFLIIYVTVVLVYVIDFYGFMESSVFFLPFFLKKITC